MSEDTLRIIILIAVFWQVVMIFVPDDFFKRKGKGSGDYDSSNTKDIVKM